MGYSNPPTRAPRTRFGYLMRTRQTKVWVMQEQEAAGTQVTQLVTSVLH